MPLEEAVDEVVDEVVDEAGFKSEIGGFGSEVILLGSDFGAFGSAAIIMR